MTRERKRDVWWFVVGRITWKLDWEDIWTMRIYENMVWGTGIIIWGFEDKNLDLYGLPNLLESACPFANKNASSQKSIFESYNMFLLCVIGSLGSVLLFGQRENQHWPGRQSLQGEGRKLIQNCVFECCVFLYFVFYCRVSIYMLCISMFADHANFLQCHGYIHFSSWLCSVWGE